MLQNAINLGGKEIIVHLFFNYLYNFIEAWVEGTFNVGSESHFCFECLRVEILYWVKLI